MNYEILPISILNGDQIKQLARLHFRVLHSLLTDLGLPFVERYYGIACNEPSVIGVCAVDGHGNPLGWAVGSPSPNQVNRRLSEAKAWFILHLLLATVSRPRVVLQLFASARASSLQLKEGAVELTYIGVDLPLRKQGLGRALLNAFVEKACDKNYSSVELSVEAENAGAIALYTLAGFEMIASFKEGAFDRQRLELKLG